MSFGEFFRALEPQHVSWPVLGLVRASLPHLTPDEQAAAADLFFSFLRRGPDNAEEWDGIFDTSLLGKESLERSIAQETLWPLSCASNMAHASR
jgi:hypothetical protein